MKTKEIRKALKSGEKVIFNRHISGSINFERIPLNAVRERQGVVYVHIRFVYRHKLKPCWVPVQPEHEDYVSIDFPPAQPVNFNQEVK